MVIPTPAAIGILAAVGLVMLVIFVIVFMRLERASTLKPIRQQDRPRAPIGWPIPPAAVEPSAPSVVRSDTAPKGTLRY